jgi:hypothetical protein
MGWIYDINKMPNAVKEGMYRILIPPSLFDRFQINPLNFENAEGQRLVRFYCPPGDRSTLIEVKLDPSYKDCIFSYQISDTVDRIKVNWDFIIVNDPFADRFDTDIDSQGRDTLFGTAERNLDAEIAAMNAGLWPGQVHKGLSIMTEFIGCLTHFCKMMSIKTVGLEALFYHNAILYEHYGFSYLEGFKRCKRIHQYLAPGGKLHGLMNGSTPFRKPEMADSVWGRSWAIHDRILEELPDDPILEGEWYSPEMYIMLEKPRASITFPEPKVK